MKINEASSFFKNLLQHTNKKSKIRVFEKFIAVLDDLEQQGLSPKQIQSIEEKLASLNFTSDSENGTKFFNRQFNLFTNYLRTDFSLITEGYYTGIRMIYGMLFGQGIGLTIGTIIGGGLGISLGISIGSALGMVFGIILGSAKDDEAKKQGRVLKIKPN